MNDMPYQSILACFLFSLRRGLWRRKNSGGKPHFSNRNVGSLEGFYYIMEKSVRLDFVLLYIEIPLQ